MLLSRLYSLSLSAVSTRFHSLTHMLLAYGLHMRHFKLHKFPNRRSTYFMLKGASTVYSFSSFHLLFQLCLALLMPTSSSLKQRVHISGRSPASNCLRIVVYTSLFHASCKSSRCSL